MKNKESWVILGCVVLCSYIFMNWNEAYSFITFFVFQQRDLLRAKEILAGHPIFFGPEMTGGGNLPGPLYYYLLAIPMWLKPVWQSAWACLIFMFMLATSIGWIFFRKYFSWLAALLFAGLFLMAPGTRRFAIIFMNVSFMIPFTLAAVTLICLAFGATTERVRERSFLGACLVIGCGLQFHFSIFALFLALVFMALFAARLKLPRVSMRTFCAGSALFLMPSVPYLTWIALGRALGQPVGYTGTAEFTVPSLLLLMTYAADVSLWKFSTDGIQHILDTIPYPLMISLLLATAFRDNETSPKTARFNKPLWICAAFTFPAFFYWFFAPIGSRYGQPFYVCVIFLTVVAFESLLRSDKKIRAFNQLAGVVLFVSCAYFLFFPTLGITRPELYPILVVALFPALVAYKYLPEVQRRGVPAAIAVALCFGLVFMQNRLTQGGEVKTVPNIMPHLTHWKKIWGAIYARTGWTWERAIHSTYFIGHHLEQDPQPGYEAGIEGIAGAAEQPHNLPDGFFVDYLKAPHDFKQRGDALRWLLEQNIPDDIKQALRAREIRIEASILPDMLVLPYHIVRAGVWPSQFHDHGEAYIRDSDEAFLDRVPGTEAAEKLAPNRFVFKWNECPEGHPFCSTGALVDVNPGADHFVSVKVRVLGQAISQVSPWISPNWTQAWVAPYVEVTCGGEVKRFTLASSIGYMREYANDPTHLHLLGNNSIVAPFDREFQVPCKGNVSAVSVGRESSNVETIYKSKKLPAKRLSVTL